VIGIGVLKVCEVIYNILVTSAVMIALKGYSMSYIAMCGRSGGALAWQPVGCEFQLCLCQDRVKPTYNS
jgi:flavoprotein